MENNSNTEFTTKEFMDEINELTNNISNQFEEFTDQFNDKFTETFNDLMTKQPMVKNFFEEINNKISNTNDIFKEYKKLLQEIEAELIKSGKLNKLIEENPEEMPHQILKKEAKAILENNIDSEKRSGSSSNSNSNVNDSTANNQRDSENNDNQDIFTDPVGYFKSFF